MIPYLTVAHGLGEGPGFTVQLVQEVARVEQPGRARVRLRGVHEKASVLGKQRHEES